MNLDKIKSRIITIQKKQVILVADVADLYGVETKHINQAIRNNPKKFPDGYIITLTNSEKEEVVKNFDHLEKLKFSSTLPRAMSEKALYMIATIIKSPIATDTTLSIIETFAKIRELSRNIAEIAGLRDERVKKNMLQKSEEFISDIIGKDLDTTATETTIEINLAVLSVKTYN